MLSEVPGTQHTGMLATVMTHPGNFLHAEAVEGRESHDILSLILDSRIGPGVYIILVEKDGNWNRTKISKVQVLFFVAGRGFFGFILGEWPF